MTNNNTNNNNNTTMSKTALKNQVKGISFRAYEAIVAHEKLLTAGKPAPVADLVTALRPCFAAYGIEAADETAVQLLTQRLVSFGVKDGQKGWKVLSVGTLRNILTNWYDAEKGIGVSRPVFSKNDKTAPDAPKAKKPPKAKKATKADLEKQLDEALKRLAKYEETPAASTATPAPEAIAAD